MNEYFAESRYQTPYAFSPILPLLLWSLSSQKQFPDTTQNILEEYDYIIVGAGAGGSTTAGRLSEEVCINVLLLEAGKSPPKLTDIPLIARSFIGSDIDWKYYTTPLKHTGAGLNNRQLLFPSGKVIGGSSIWNALLYVRGSRHIYDKWKAGGAIGWSYDDVLPYFKKMEQNRNLDSIEIPYRGFNGPITVEKPQYNSAYKSAIEKAIIEFNYSVIDPNGRNQKGFYNYQSTMRNGQRCSAAKGYLVPAEERTNLDIVKNALVTKILIKNGKAVGVEYEMLGIHYTVRAKKEVILSAGTVNTAQLLMLSGIGPKKHLEDIGIPLVADLPVGENFHDHCGCYVTFYSDKLTPIKKELIKPFNVFNYILYKSGLLAMSEGVPYLAFLTNEKSTLPEVIPDYMLYFNDGDTSTVKSQLNLNAKVYEQVFKPYEDKSNLWCLSSVLHPKSRGSVKLKSANPHDSPLIDPNYFDDPADLKDVVEGMKECYRILSSKGIRAIGGKPYETLIPGCEKYVKDQDRYLECIARSFIFPFSHQVGTVKMGDPRDPSTVVDTKLRVKGIEGLRVVDASIMPIIPTGNTNVPTMMVAEKAADIIKEEI